VISRQSHPNRRQFMQSVLAVGAGVGLTQVLARPARARSQATPIASNRLNDRLVVLSGAGANVVALHGPDGILLVDGGLAQRSRDLLDAMYRETRAKQVQTLINTHWHPEQTGSNEALSKAGAKIIAHENTRRWLEYPQTEPGHDRPWGPLPVKARPSETLVSSVNLSSRALEFAGEKLECRYLLQAHTDGDLCVLFRDSNVLVAGGAVSNEGWPVIDYETGGWIGGLVEGLKALDGLVDDKTRIVPANGPVMGRAELKAQHTMYATIFDRLGKLLRKGMGPEEVLAAEPTKEFDAKWGDPRQSTTLAFKSMWGHLAPDA
jgi:glyoxylase-like metal-dependent hydrolase (beta-lactamase superfamily II)